MVGLDSLLDEYMSELALAGEAAKCGGVWATGSMYQASVWGTAACIDKPAPEAVFAPAIYSRSQLRGRNGAASTFCKAAYAMDRHAPVSCGIANMALSGGFLVRRMGPTGLHRKWRDFKQMTALFDLCW